MERLGSNSGVIEVLGTIRCPNDGCPNDARSVRLFGALEVAETCEDCQRKAEDKLLGEEHLEALERLFRIAGATPLYREWSLDTFPQDSQDYLDALSFAEGWLSRYRNGMCENAILYGPQGGGKTGLAWAMIRDLIERDLTMCRIVTWRDALDVMRDGFRRQEPTGEMRTLKNVPVLVLDDVGSEKPTDFAREQLLTLVDYRHVHMLPTIYTANFTPDELADRLGHDDLIVGKRIVSRMAGRAVQFILDVPDRRMVA